MLVVLTDSISVGPKNEKVGLGGKSLILAQFNEKFSNTNKINALGYTKERCNNKCSAASSL